MLRVKDAISTGSNISIEAAGSNFIAPNNYGYMGKDTGGNARYLMYMNTSNQVNVGYDNRLVKLDCTNPIQREGYKIYHEGYKPTALQIGALPTSGGDVGSIRVQGESQFYTHTFVDPWPNTMAAIKVTGDIALIGKVLCNGAELTWIEDRDDAANWICIDTASGINSQITFRPDSDNKGNIGHANYTWNYANITSVSNRSAIRPESAYQVSHVNTNDEMYDMVKNMNFYIHKEVSVKEYEEVETLKATDEYQNASKEEKNTLIKNIKKITPSQYDYSKNCRITTNAEELPFEVAPLNNKSDGTRDIDVVAFSTGLASALQKAIHKIEVLEQRIEILENNKGE